MPKKAKPMGTFRPVTSWDDVPVIMDLAMAYRITRLTPDTIRQKIVKGEFPGKKIGNRIYIGKDELRDWTLGKWNPEAAS